MISSVNLPLCASVLAECGGADGLRRELSALGLDGVEGIWGGENIPADFPPELLTGYHLTFFPDWLDCYREDCPALVQKFGSLDAARRFYGGLGAEWLLGLYRDDLARAQRLGAKYVVFHVSDVSMEEGFAYRWLHTDEEVLVASAEVINHLLAGVVPTFDFLVENQWWPGFTFTDPAKTQRLLDRIAYPRTGILLDTGHLMNTDPHLRTQADGLAYLHEMLSRHGALCGRILGVHLHQSLSGAYVRRHTGQLPDHWPEDPVQRFAVSYPHIQKIDRHRPWTHPGVADLLARIAPRYLTHELAAGNRQERFQRVRRQQNTLQKGARGEKQVN